MVSHNRCDSVSPHIKIEPHSKLPYDLGLGLKGWLRNQSVKGMTSVKLPFLLGDYLLPKIYKQFQRKV